MGDELRGGLRGWGDICGGVRASEEEAAYRNGQVPGSQSPRWVAMERCVAAVAVSPGVAAGSPKRSGTIRTGARSIVATTGGRSRSRWRAVRTTLARPAGCRLRGGCGCRHTPCGSRRRAGWPVRRASWWRRARGPTGRGTRPGIRWRSAWRQPAAGGASTSRPRRAMSRPRADARPCSLSAPALQRSRRSRPACRTACTSAPRTVGMVFLECLRLPGSAWGVKSLTCTNLGSVA